MSHVILDKDLEQWKKEFPQLEELIKTEPLTWLNQKKTDDELIHLHIEEAEQRLRRFAPYLAKVFPETQESRGIIESPIQRVMLAENEVEKQFDLTISGQLWLKCDHQLPISGSIKARGGIYEVLAHAEELALKHELLKETDDYSVLADESFRSFFSSYKIAVGSTGNLGLSIGVMGAKLGFQVTVHMSADAKQWKKDLLRTRGVEVIEYTSDYSKAVEEGRKQAEADPITHFVDDENSTTLFVGYATAAKRLADQLAEQGLEVSAEHPLIVYLPCGVGGGPGGVTYGLKQEFGEHVHCFFVEPTHSPCMVLGMMTGYHDQVSVQDFGIDNQTIADGLAVGRASGFVGKLMEPLISGIMTVDDSMLYKLQALLMDTEKIQLEPSAVAGLAGMIQLQKDHAPHNLTDATHLVWATGGSMVPAEQMQKEYQIGKTLWDKEK
ncbi:D-serine ammonia-lyase [Alkalihalobacillus sp. FSL W8-0930]